MIAEIVLPADIRYLHLASLTALKVAEIFADSLKTAKGSAEFCHAFELSVTEAFANAVNYSKDTAPENMVHITYSSEGKNLTVSVSDNNQPFDPDTPAPDISTYPDKGFGLLLIHRLMDSVSYTREHGINLISMTKQATAPEHLK